MGEHEVLQCGALIEKRIELLLRHKIRAKKYGFFVSLV